MRPPAPPRLSSTSCWPSAADMLGVTVRASTSGVPPAGTDTTTLIGFVGYVCAAAGAEINGAATTAAASSDNCIAPSRREHNPGETHAPRLTTWGKGGYGGKPWKVVVTFGEARAFRRAPPL